MPLVLMSAMAADPAIAARAAFHAPPVPQVKVLPRIPVTTKARQIPVTPHLARTHTAWPVSGSATVAVPPSNAHSGVRAGTLPVVLKAAPAAPSGSAPSGSAASGSAASGSNAARAAAPAQSSFSVTVKVLDHAQATAARVPGVLFSLAPAAGSGQAAVSVDYSSFENAGGPDFAGRLRLVQLPACALTTPKVAACQVQTPLASTNDAAAKTVTATVGIGATRSSATQSSATQSSASPSASAQPLVMALDTAGSGPNGDYTATSISPSGTWSEGGAAGDFTWSYPISVPKPAAGAAPSVALNYNSADVDGRIATTNNQFGPIGEGFTLSSSYIGRAYTDCADDPEGAIKDDYDNCWAGQVVNLVLDGKTTPLIVDSAGTWHEQQDSGDRVQYLTGSAADTGNGTHDNGYWLVTTPDGTQYYFGKNKGPGWASGNPVTNSTFTEPVYGAHSGDPCYNSSGGFAQSSCSQAWQWNLDFVVDPNGNAQAYYYQPETGYYGADNKTTPVSYTRGGYPTEIDYGLHEAGGSIYGTTAPQKVVFGTGLRCFASGTTTCDFTSTNTAAWPDTPVDQLCASSGTCNNHAPTFFSEYRIDQITTEYYPSGSTTPLPVDSYALGQSFSNQGDDELLLNTITRTGNDASGNQLSLLPVTLTYNLMDNRVPGYNTQPSMSHWRLTEVETETGETIDVSYSSTCALSDIPSDASQDTGLCYPIYWTPQGKTAAILDYFNKYVVTQVEVADPEALTPPQLTKYVYPPGAVLWHYDDNQLVKSANRTYGQFRGYPEVDTLSGDVADNSMNGTADVQSETKTLYYRGMNADVLPGGGSRTANVTDTVGDSYPDNNAFADQVLETQKLDAVGGPEVSASISTLAVTATTGTMSVSGLPTLQATMIAPTLQRSITDLAAGGTRTKTVKTVYDGYGRAVLTDTSGPGIAQSCVQTSYAGPTPNPATSTPNPWITSAVSETITSAQACPASPGSLTSADILADTRTYYDSSTTLGAAPSVGNPTSVSKAVVNSAGALTFQTDSSTTYDPMGRVLSSTNARGNTTKTSYTPASGGPLTGETVTNALNQNSTKTVDPGRGSTLTSTDVSGYTTTEAYDPLGRVTAVWKPGRAQPASANITYAYAVSQTKPLAVTTNTLVDYGTGTDYQTEISIFDALGQLLQTQTEAEGGNTAATETFYDSHGWVVASYNKYVVAGNPTTTIATEAYSAVNDRTVTFFDAAGRTTRQDVYNGASLTNSTQTVYGGDRTSTIKHDPAGVVIGTPATTVTDLNGKTVESDQYTAAPTVNGNVVTPSAGGTMLATTTAYDAAGNKTKVTDSASNTWTYQYDLLGRQTSATDPDTGTTTTTYDADGNTASTTDANGTSVNYVYDVLDRKTTQYTGSTTQGSGTKIATWVYDTLKHGKLSYETSISPTSGAVYYTGYLGYDTEGNANGSFATIPSSVTGLSGTYETRESYSSTNLLLSESPQGGGNLPNDSLAFSYDQYGNLQSETGYDVYATSATYTPYGQLSQVLLGSGPSAGSLTYTYDPQTGKEKEVNLSVSAPTPQVDDTQYMYNADQQLVKSTDTEGGSGVGAPVETQCFTYDMLNRLTAAWSATDNCAADPFPANNNATVGGPQPYAQSWSFDNLGDRIRETDLAPAGSSAGTTTTTYTYSTAGHAHALSSTSASNTVSGQGPTTTYGYDSDGNTKTRASGTETLGWGPTGKLASDANTKGTTGYIYDADGNLLIESDPGSATLFLPNEQFTYTTSTAAKTGVRFYSFGGHVLGENTGGNLYWLEGDDQGTMSVAANAFAPAQVTRRVLTPYGGPVAGSAAWVDNRSFLGDAQQAATGLVDVGARDYDPSLGAFISVDPNMDSGDPQSMTGYGYAGGNPWSNPDPSGLSWWSAVTHVVNTVAKVAAVAAPVLNVVAVATAAVPGLDVVTAGLAATADVVSTVANVANVASGVVNVVNDVKDHKPLLETGLDIVGTVVGAKGLKSAGADTLENQSVRQAIVSNNRDLSDDEFARLDSRAQEVHELLPDYVKNRHLQDTVAMSTEEGTDVLAGGVTDIRPIQRPAINEDDLEARMSGQHAEVTAVTRAKQAGLTPSHLSTYPESFCPACQQYLEEEGFRLVDDFHAVYRFGGGRAFL